MAWATRHERTAGRITGSVKQPASGSLWWAKADLKDSEWLTEVKATKKRSFRVTPKIWNTLVEQALNVRRKPRLMVCLNPAPGLETWYMVTGHSELTKGFVISDGDDSLYYEGGLQVRLLDYYAAGVR